MEFNLQEGEKIVKDFTPVKNVLWYLMLIGVVPIGLVMSFFTFLFGVVVAAEKEWLNLFLVSGVTSAIFLCLLVLIVAVSWLQYHKFHYWITNKRIVFKKGIIGFSISSIPLERISDIILSRSFAETLFGFGSLHVQSLAGQVTYSNRRGSEASLMGVPEPEKTQELIFKLIKEKRQREKLSF